MDMGLNDKTACVTASTPELGHGCAFLCSRWAGSFPEQNLEPDRGSSPILL